MWCPANQNAAPRWCLHTPLNDKPRGGVVSRSAESRPLMSICECRWSSPLWQNISSHQLPPGTEKWMSPGLMGTEQGILTLDESPIALNTHTDTLSTENTAVTQSVKITGWKILTCAQTLSLFSLCLVLCKCKSFCLTEARHVIQYFMTASLHSPFTLTAAACIKHGLGLRDVSAIDFK